LSDTLLSRTEVLIGWRIAVGVAALIPAACKAPTAEPYTAVETVIAPAPAHASTSPGQPSDRPSASTPAPPPQSQASMDGRVDEPIATVDGVPIGRERLVGLLLRGHGAARLEQLIVLERAQRRAARLGVVVNQADIDAEYDRGLGRALASFGWKAPDDPISDSDRRHAEAQLDQYLAERNVSRAEFQLLVRISAYLRGLIESELTIEESELRLEFERLHGPKVEIRHIPLATLAEANRVTERLAAGDSFSTLARLYSPNASTASEGGLLPPFTVDDPDVPALLRETAFGLEPGQVSMPIRVEPWYYLIRVERRIAASARSFDDARAELEQRVRDRTLRPGMERLYRELLDEADIRVSDPALNDAFERRRRDRLDGFRPATPAEAAADTTGRTP